MRKSVYVVCPCYNEESGLERFFEQLRGAVDGLELLGGGKVVFVDDGSSDHTWEVVFSLRARYPGKIAAVKLSRNFGHQAAICAGLDYIVEELKCVTEDTIIIMDSDGQHPPSCIPQMLEARERGFHHVQMVRLSQPSSLLKRLTSNGFYRIFSFLSRIRIPSGASDFRAFSGYFLFQYRKATESVRFNRGLFYWMGFKTQFISYKAEERIAGSTSYSFVKMFRLSIDGLSYFSSRPLVLITAGTSLLGTGVCLAYLTYEIYRFSLGIRFVPGWFTIIFAVSFWGTLLSLIHLVFAVYLARIFDEVKRRPAYIIEEHQR